MVRFRGFLLLALSMSVAALTAVPVLGQSVADPSGLSKCPSGIGGPFSDIGHLSVADRHAINCILQYGITKGTGADTYSPNQPVTVGQMYLFLVRMVVEKSPLPRVGTPIWEDRAYYATGFSSRRLNEGFLDVYAVLDTWTGRAGTPPLNVTYWFGIRNSLGEFAPVVGEFECDAYGLSSEQCPSIAKEPGLELGEAAAQLHQAGIIELDMGNFHPFHGPQAPSDAFYAYHTVDPLSRVEMARLLTATLEFLGVDVGAQTGGRQFSDVGRLLPADQAAINQLAGLGISQGVGNNRFDPDGTVDRYQMALFLARAMTHLGL